MLTREQFWRYKYETVRFEETFQIQKIGIITELETNVCSETFQYHAKHLEMGKLGPVRAETNKSSS